MLATNKDWSRHSSSDRNSTKASSSTVTQSTIEDQTGGVHMSSSSRGSLDGTTHDSRSRNMSDDNINNCRSSSKFSGDRTPLGEGSSLQLNCRGSNGRSDDHRCDGKMPSPTSTRNSTSIGYGLAVPTTTSLDYCQNGTRDSSAVVTQRKGLRNIHFNLYISI